MSQISNYSLIGYVILTPNVNNNLAKLHNAKMKYSD